MLNFVSRAFEGFLEVFLWLNLITCAIIGAVMGGDDRGVGYAVLGFILGAAVGLIYNIIVGGILVIFVNLHKEVSKIRKKLSPEDFENKGLENKDFDVFENDYTNKVDKKLFDEELKAMDL